MRNFDYSVIFGQFDDAIAETRRGIEIDPSNFLIHHGGLGVDLVLRTSLAEAVDQFRDAIDLDPAHVFSRCGSARPTASWASTSLAITF